MDYLQSINLLAIFLGPVLAVLATRYLDSRNARHEQRMAVFKTLMRTRRTPVVPEHVGALNLVEIEFKDDKEVIGAWKHLYSHLGEEHVRKKSELRDDSLSAEENRNRDNQFGGRIFDERQRLLAKLLHSIARALRFKVEQLEIFEGGYTPQGWFDDDLEGRAVRRLLVEVAQGSRVFPIGVFDYTQMAGVSGEPTKVEGVA